jgi:hypothetical protein
MIGIHLEGFVLHGRIRNGSSQAWLQVSDLLKSPIDEIGISHNDCTIGQTIESPRRKLLLIAARRSRTNHRPKIKRWLKGEYSKPRCMIKAMTRCYGLLLVSSLFAEMGSDHHRSGQDSLGDKGTA